MLASLCPTHVHLTTSRRFDAPLEEYCKRIAAGDQSVEELVALGRAQFRCAGPWGTTICVTHALRQTINAKKCPKASWGKNTRRNFAKICGETAR